MDTPVRANQQILKLSGLGGHLIQLGGLIKSDST